MANISDIKRTAKVSEYIEAYDFEVYDILGTIDFFKRNRPILYFSIGLYLAGIYFGQKWMKNRPAFKLNTALFLWNLGLSVFSIVATVRGLPEVLYLLSKPDGLYRSLCSGEVHNYASSFWPLMFFLSKFVEFGDTAFIVLRKQKLIILHWYHHVATLLICWYGYEFYDTAGRYFIVNSFVHSLMYPYFALKALKVKVPRRVAMALTTIQILQMFFYLFLNSYTVKKMSDGYPCGRHDDIIWIAKIVGGSFAILFINFFIRTYFLQGKKTEKVQ